MNFLLIASISSVFAYENWSIKPQSSEIRSELTDTVNIRQEHDHFSDNISDILQKLWDFKNISTKNEFIWAFLTAILSNTCLVMEIEQNHKLEEIKSLVDEIIKPGT